MNDTDKRLSRVEKFGYGLGDFASNVVWQSVLLLLPVFYTDVFGLSAAAMGTMFLVVRLLDTVTDPVMGVVADHTKSRWGQYRPYLLWVAVPFAILFVLTFTTPPLGESQKVVYAYGSYALLIIFYTMVNVPYSALGGVITADSQERVSANSYRFVLANAAAVMITFCVPQLVDLIGQGDSQVGYPWAMAIFGLLAIVAFFVCFALTRERVKQAAPIKASLALDFQTLFRNDQWLVIAVLAFLVLIPIVLRGGVAAYYIKWFAQRPDLTAAFLTSGAVAAMIGAAFASPLTRRIDKVPAYILIQSVIVASSFALYFVSATDLTLIFALYSTINFFIAMSAPILFTMAADTVEYGELKTGKRITGLVFSGFLFALKLGSAVGGSLIGIVLATHGYDGAAHTQTPEATEGIVLALTLLPALGHFLVIPVISFFRLNRRRCNEIRIQIEERSSRIN